MFRKTKIAAVTAVVLGLSSVAFAPAAQAVSLNESGATGEVLIFPYYNVNNNFITSYNITNTTNTYKAVKIRFRESKTSNDVLDFNVYMSPWDVFSMTLSADGEGVKLRTSDKTCTFPEIPADGEAFRGFYDNTKNDPSIMREGYLEVIEMGEVMQDATVLVETKPDKFEQKLIAKEGLLHDKNGVPENCDVVRLAWHTGVFVQGGALSNSDGTSATEIHHVDPRAIGFPNGAALGGTGLTGDANNQTVSDLGYYGTNSGQWNEKVGALTEPTGGLAGSSVLIDLANMAGFVVEPASVVHYSSHAQHYLSADEHFYLLPSLASGSGAAAGDTAYNTSDDFMTTVATKWDTVVRDFGLDDLNVSPFQSVPSGINPFPIAHALAVTKISNQYFVEGDSATDWVVSAPMRKHGIFNGYEYVAPVAVTDLPGDAIIIGLKKSDDTEAKKKAAIASNGYWDRSSSTKKDIRATFTYYDREEQLDVVEAETGNFSPPLPTDDKDAKFRFNNEVNIIAFTIDKTDASVLGSNNAQGFSLANGFENGWASLDFSDYKLDATRYSAWMNGPSDPVDPEADGAPLLGFASATTILSGSTVGETFPHIIMRKRGN